MPEPDGTTLVGVVTLLVRHTGHYQLVGTQVSGGDTVPDYSVDAGAYEFVNRAVRWWDRQARHSSKVRKSRIAIAAGDAQVTVPSVFSVASMRFTDSQEYLTQSEESWLYANVGADLEALDSVETPLYWARATKSVGDEDEVFWITPPPSTNRTVEVMGYYYSAPLTTGTDTNWWLSRFPEAVLYVAMQMVNDLDMNPFTNATLKAMIEDVKRSMWTDDIQEEIAMYGSTMAG